MKRILIVVLLIVTRHLTFGENYVMKSPDQKITVRIDVNKIISYQVDYNNKTILDSSPLSFTFAQSPPLGQDMVVKNVEKKTVDETWKPVLQRFDSIRNYYNSIVLQMVELRFPERKMNLEFRVFDNGVAFRTEFPAQFSSFRFTMTDELSSFNFADNYTCWAVNYGSYTTSQEMPFLERKIGDITPDMVIGLPMTVKAGDNCYVAITEADLDDYAGMYLKSDAQTGPYAVRTQLAPRRGQPENGEKVIFSTPHNTPWRVIMVGNTPGDLVESEIIQNLNEPCRIEDPSWIKPGLSAWDHWWSGEVKMEQPVIYQYIDLASSMGWPYMLIDWQWYGPYNQDNADITKPAPQLNMPEILQYAKSKNVKCWLWLYNTDVDRSDFDKVCALYESWGIAGIKIDFMNSDDQQMVNWYHRIVKTAAQHHLMVDFHGAYKPTGWRRTYPNLVTREGVMGNEYNKWSLMVTPEHLTTLPFTRMLAGPMDFTPGGFLNRNPDKFRPGTPAEVLGTRSNTLAEFVVFDSPYTVACDHPDHYYGQTGEDFLKEVKSMWDDTRVLNGAVGEYITMARRSGKDWFIGSMANSLGKDLEITLGFLGTGNYRMTSYSDSEETKENAEVAVKKETIVKRSDIVKISMVPGGGFAAYLTPVK